MDPFSGEGELLTITTHFHTHAYTKVLEYDTSPLSPPNRSIARILQHRSRIALGQSRQVLSQLSSAKDAASQAIQALAHQSLGNDKGVELARELAETDGEDSVVQVVCGTVLAAAGEYEKAVELLGKHQGNLEAVALLTQIYLLQNRTDLALKEVQAAKRWAQDSLLINLAEAWLGLRVGGDKYQSSYYIYEELASTPSTTTASSLVAQAVADMHLNRLPEADATLQQALELDPHDAHARANQVVLACLMGRKRPDVEGLVAGLSDVDDGHPLVRGLGEMEARFDEAAGRYQARVAAG
ncbi:hypothetical protein EPUS_05885 [Endocarpon pusillum Z07020]|uniref:Coatomer subunit epsilon n=1 Tax=Endocarpon pusillum (strain Z07020 / HMAS-L-300199) TaxID=1263415 RepID=U1GNK2_ENDPU|nr:uncharacterized protein EPUS_05885 [Endocarpon pusillum Z07020]ERF73873.1 hypothetical protein EPUS_05885 [Endocarpon pusillum Z07020]